MTTLIIVAVLAVAVYFIYKSGKSKGTSNGPTGGTGSGSGYGYGSSDGNDQDGYDSVTR